MTVSTLSLTDTRVSREEIPPVDDEEVSTLDSQFQPDVTETPPPANVLPSSVDIVTHTTGETNNTYTDGETLMYKNIARAHCRSRGNNLKKLLRGLYYPCSRTNKFSN